MKRSGGHAVVLGASLAGLVHAVPLAARFDSVTLVERDRLPERAEQRRGVPQGRHAHLLVPGGVKRLEALLPGVLADLTERGAHLIPAPEWRFFMGGDQLALTDPELRITGVTRPLLERVVRDRVLALEGVELLDGWTAGLVTTSDDGARVDGVRIRSGTDGGTERTLGADLVVDATGRGSSAPQWLADVGYEPPKEQRLEVGVRYATRLFRRDPADLDGCRHVLVDIPPKDRRGGVALAVEGDRWLVTLIGMLGERPPVDPGGFVAYADSLWAEDIHAIVDGAAAVDDAVPTTFPAFSWHRYDQLRRFPERFVVVGDAVCSFDPRFGQGMTVAIIEATELGGALDRHGLDRIGQRVFAATRPVVEDAWTTATGADLAHPEVDGARPLSWRLTTAYLQRLLTVAHHDPDVAAAFVRVIGMLDRPQELLQPRILGRVVFGGRSSRRADGPAPPVSAAA